MIDKKKQKIIRDKNGRLKVVSRFKDTTPTTEKQRKAYKLLKTGFVSSEREAFRLAGYKSPPHEIKKTQGWQALMEQYLPEERLVSKHLELLNASKEEVQVKALDLAYKLKGSYAPEKTQAINLNVDVSVDNSEAEAIRKEYEQKLKDSLKDNSKGQIKDNE